MTERRMILHREAGEGDHAQRGGGGGGLREARPPEIKTISDRLEVASAPSTASRSPSPAGGGGCPRIQGYASLWGVADLNGDVVARGAFGGALARAAPGDIKMLFQHDGRAPVGAWDELVEDDRGLWVRGRIADWSPEARFAGALVRAGALDGLSIGYRTTRARRAGRLRVLSEVELWEVSLVTFPMLPGARFRVVKE